MSTRTEIIGQDQEAPFVAFGDDSQYNGVLVFSYVVVPKTHLCRVLKGIESIKKKFKFPTGTAIHCRVLFSGNQRDKYGLSHLGKEEIQSIIHHAVSIINKNYVFLRYAYARTENLNGIFEDNGTITLEHESDGSKIELPAMFEPKGIIGLLAQSCLAANPVGYQGPTASQCEIYAAEDKTKVRFIGNNRNSADGLIQGYSDVGAPKGTVFLIKPTIASNDFSPIFELADIAAYICSHAIHGKEKESFFCGVLARVKYWTRSEFLLNPE